MQRNNLFETERILRESIHDVTCKLHQAKRNEATPDVIARLSQSKDMLMAEWKRKGELIG